MKNNLAVTQLKYPRAKQLGKGKQLHHKNHLRAQWIKVDTIRSSKLKWMQVLLVWGQWKWNWCAQLYVQEVMQKVYSHSYMASASANGGIQTVCWFQLDSNSNTDDKFSPLFSHDDGWIRSRSETSLFPLQLLQDYSQHNQLVKIPYCQ